MPCNCSYHARNACNPCDYFSRMGVSYSRWCSTGDPSAPFVSYAYLTQLDALTLEPGGAVPFTGAQMLTSGFAQEDADLLIRNAGTYRAEYVIVVPADAALDTTFTLVVGGIPIAGTQVSAVHAAGDPTVTLTAQAIFEATGATTVQLISEDGVDLIAENEGDLVASLTVVQL